MTLYPCAGSGPFRIHYLGPGDTVFSGRALSGMGATRINYDPIRF